MMDLPQGADLAAHRLIAGGAVEELERSLLTLDVVAHAIDLRKAALPEYVQYLEAALKDVADSHSQQPWPRPRLAPLLGRVPGALGCRLRAVQRPIPREDRRAQQM